MAQQLGVFTAQTEDQGTVPSMYMVAYNFLEL